VLPEAAQELAVEKTNASKSNSSSASTILITQLRFFDSRTTFGRGWPESLLKEFASIFEVSAAFHITSGQPKLLPLSWYWQIEVVR
jgi:hypothetical protein